MKINIGNVISGKYLYTDVRIVNGPDLGTGTKVQYIVYCIQYILVVYLTVYSIS